LAASQAVARTMDYDERFRFRNSSTMDNAKGLMGSGSSSSAPVTVNLTVNGSVSTEQDLVSAVRNGLLATQTNGNTLTLQAI
jgi:archaellum component FlaF (FlaF/FlaG flagellin family)